MGLLRARRTMPIHCMSPRLRTFDRDWEPRNPGAERIHLERGTVSAARSKIASLNTLGLGVPKQTGESIC